MKQIRVVVKFKEGLHARPAVKLIKLLSGTQSEVTIIKNNEAYQAKSITSLLSAGITCGNSISIKVEGPDEEKVAADLESYFA